jgi:hypothetical protein
VEKQALLKGELTRSVCSKCGVAVEVVYPLLYHDSAKKLMIWRVIEGQQLDNAAMSGGAFMRDYQFRIVTNRNHLVEKILIFGHGLDDRVVEFAKFLLRKGAKDAGQSLSGELLFNGKCKNVSGEEAIEYVVMKPTGFEKLATPMATFTEITNALASKLPPAQSESGKWLTVDECYAMELAQRF